MAIVLKPKVWLKSAELKAAVAKASIAPLDKAAMLVEADAKASMKEGGGSSHAPSKAPAPPHVQTGNLRSSITWAADGKTRVIGPTTVAWYGRIHEFGGVYGGKTFPARPFMRPALRRMRQKFAALFRGLDIRIGGD